MVDAPRVGSPSKFCCGENLVPVESMVLVETHVLVGDMFLWEHIVISI